MLHRGFKIKNLIITSKTKVPRLNYVSDSAIGENCNLRAGTKIANLRLDGKVIHVTVKGKKISTGRKKFGAIIEAYVKTGINVSINVGTTIDNDVYIAPSAKVKVYLELIRKSFRCLNGSNYFGNWRRAEIETAYCK